MINLVSFCSLFLPRYAETGFGQMVSKLPTRWLPPGSLRLLYEEFKQSHPTVSFLGWICFFLRFGLRRTCRLLQTLRYVSFWRRYNKSWTGVLKFLPPTTHSTCDICLDFKLKFRKCRETCHSSWGFLVPQTPAI